MHGLIETLTFSGISSDVRKWNVHTSHIKRCS